MEESKMCMRKGEKGARELICCQTRELPNEWLSMFGYDPCCRDDNTNHPIHS